MNEVSISTEPPQEVETGESHSERICKEAQLPYEAYEALFNRVKGLGLQRERPIELLAEDVWKVKARTREYLLCRSEDALTKYATQLLVDRYYEIFQKGSSITAPWHQYTDEDKMRIAKDFAHDEISMEGWQGILETFEKQISLLPNGFVFLRSRVQEFGFYWKP